LTARSGQAARVDCRQAQTADPRRLSNSRGHQDGSDVVIAFNGTTGIYIKDHTIAQLDAGDFVFA
jgi:hypothetical protein